VPTDHLAHRPRGRLRPASPPPPPLPAQDRLFRRGADGRFEAVARGRDPPPPVEQRDILALLALPLEAPRERDGWVDVTSSPPPQPSARRQHVFEVLSLAHVLA
jgi:hypothetical protein